MNLFADKHGSGATRGGARRLSAPGTEIEGRMCPLLLVSRKEDVPREDILPKSYVFVYLDRETSHGNAKGRVAESS